MGLEISRRAAGIAPSVTMAIDAKAKAMRARGLDVIGFGAGEPDFPTPAAVCEAAKRAIDAGQTKYTPVGGTPELKARIAEKLKSENGVEYAPEELIASSGAKQSIYHALCALLDPGDEVLIPAPCWVSYPEIVRMAGGTPVFVPASEREGFAVSAERLAEKVTSRTKALILNSPNNPTGNVASEGALAGIAELALKDKFYVMSDEIYEKLVYGVPHVSIASLGSEIRAQTILINGVSKSYAMTGWRIGYAAGPRRVIEAMTNYQSHSASNPSSIAQAAAAAALSGDGGEGRAMAEEFGVRRTLIHGLVNAIPGLRANLPEGAFYLMVNISGVVGRRRLGRAIDGSVAFAEELLDAKRVAAVPAKAFEADMHVRLSFAKSRGDIERGVARIGEFVAELEG